MDRNWAGALGALACVAIAAPAYAVERGVVDAKVKLDRLEPKVKRLEQGDFKTANALIKEVNAAKAALAGCKNHKASQWQIQAKRANALDAEIRTRVEGKAAEAGEAGEPDAPTLAAKKLVDEVEASLKSMKPGDVPTANVLIKKLNASRTELSKSRQRNNAVWQKTKERAAALDKAIRARASQAASSGGAEGSGGGAVNAEFTTIPPDDPPMSVRDRVAWRRYGGALANMIPSISAEAPRRLGTKPAFEARLRLVKQYREKLGKLQDPGHPRPRWAAKVLKRYLEIAQAKHEEGKKLLAADQAAAQQEASEVDGELREIETFFDPKTFSCVLEAPYTPQRVEEWVAKLREYQAMQTKGVALVDKFVEERPRYAKHQRVRNLRYVFEKVLPRKIGEGIDETTGWIKTGSGTKAGHLVHRIDLGKRLLEFTKDGIKERNLADDDWVRKSLTRLDEAIEAARAQKLFDSLWHKKPSPQYDVLAASFAGLRTKLGGAAKRLLQQTRMPKAASTSAALRKIATETLAKKKYGVGDYQRLVINSDKQTKTERKSEAKVEGDYLKIWRWTEKWDEFQCCLAESVEGETRLVYYTLKYLHVGPHWKPTGRWYVHQRIVSRRILPENVDK